MTLGIAAAGLPLLYYLRFDFNPMNLRSPKVELIATYLDLRRDPAPGRMPSTSWRLRVRRPKRRKRRLKALPQVDRVMTIADFIPADQPAKLDLIAKAAAVLDPVLHVPARPAPTDAENVEALQRAIKGLTEAAAEREGTGADAAKRLAAALIEAGEGR